jgi:hypothetical protein
MPSSDASVGSGEALLRVVLEARGLAAADEADALPRVPAGSWLTALLVDRARGLAAVLATGSAAGFAAARVEGLRVRGFRVTVGPVVASAWADCVGTSVPSVPETPAG